MADQLQLRGGTTSEHSTFTGALREVTVDTDKDVLVVHDNSTAGGHPLMAEDGSNSALALGSAGTPSLKFTGDTNTGVFSPAADTVGVSTGGSERARIDSSGRLLVGATSSTTVLSTAAALQVVGSTSNQANINILRTANEPTYLHFSSGSNGNDLVDDKIIARVNFAGYHTSGYTAAARIDCAVDGTPGENDMPGRLVFSTTADGASSVTERMRIDSSGNVGIGTASPAAPLAVLSTSSTYQGMELITPASDGSGEFIFGVHQSGSTAGRSIVFKRGGSDGTASESCRIDASGRLLVGTSSTSNTCTAVFTGRNDSSTANPVIRLQPATTAPASGNTLGNISFSSNGTSAFEAAAWITANRDGGTWTAGSSHPGRLEFATCANGTASPEQRMRIANNGFTTSFSAGNDLSLKTGQAAGTTYFLLAGTHSCTSLSVGGTTSFYVWTNGNVQNTNNSYTGISDIKLKENIVDASSQWDDLKAIQVRKYNFKEETGHETFTQIGVIAQEIELVSPGLVSESPDKDDEGNDLGTVTKSVNYSVLYMKAVKALQEAMERIETLEANNVSLEARLAALEAN